MKNFMFMSMGIFFLSLTIRMWWIRIAINNTRNENIYHHNKPEVNARREK